MRTIVLNTDTLKKTRKEFDLGQSRHSGGLRLAVLLGLVVHHSRQHCLVQERLPREFFKSECARRLQCGEGMNAATKNFCSPREPALSSIFSRCLKCFTAQFNPLGLNPKGT